MNIKKLYVELYTAKQAGEIDPKTAETIAAITSPHTYYTKKFENKRTGEEGGYLANSLTDNAINALGGGAAFALNKGLKAPKAVSLIPLVASLAAVPAYNVYKGLSHKTLVDRVRDKLSGN